jgi:glycosyltransferase involved in cell wall biosynthesis
MLAALSGFSPQIVHGQTCRVLRAIKDLARRTSVPIVMTLHSPPPKLRAFRRLSARLGGIIATTQHVREELVNRARVAKAKIAVIPNGIDVSALRAREIRATFSGAAPVIGSVGPVEKKRGHELFVRAAARLVSAGKQFQFLVGGHGEELPGLRELSSSLGLDSCITFVDDLQSYDQVLNAIDVVVQSSQVDVSGFSILKAMGYGRPVIAFNTGTACEIVEDNTTGLLVPREDVGKLAQAIGALAENPQRARQMGQAALAKVAERFNVEKVAQTTLDFYSALLSANRRPTG